MNTREALRRRPDIAVEDIDEIVALAADLQAASAPRGATVEQVQAVAEELDVDPRYVEEALGLLRQRRKEQAEALSRRQRVRTRALQGAAAGMLLLGVVALLGAGLAFGTAWRAASGLTAAHDQVARSASSVQVVLDRQAALVPQLVALSGGDPAPLQAKVQAMRQAPDLAARLEASRALDDALAQVLAELPPTDPTGQRAGLVHELTGVQNRLAVETRRYEEALADYRLAASRRGGGLAVSLGLAPSP